MNDKVDLRRVLYTTESSKQASVVGWGDEPRT